MSKEKTFMVVTKCQSENRYRVDRSDNLVKRFLIKIHICYKIISQSIAQNRKIMQLKSYRGTKASKQIHSDKQHRGRGTEYF